MSKVHKLEIFSRSLTCLVRVRHLDLNYKVESTLVVCSMSYKVFLDITSGQSLHLAQIILLVLESDLQNTFFSVNSLKYHFICLCFLCYLLWCCKRSWLWGFQYCNPSSFMVCRLAPIYHWGCYGSCPTNLNSCALFNYFGLVVFIWLMVFSRVTRSLMTKFLKD